MILSFKKTFPDGTPTNFKEKILSGEKIHTIRKDEGRRWKTIYPIHMAHGVRTKHYEQFNTGRKDLGMCRGVQEVFMTLINNWIEISVDGRYLDQDEIQLLIKNDGITEDQFVNWFFPGDVDEYSGRIIHWTDFKY